MLVLYWEGEKLKKVLYIVSDVINGQIYGLNDDPSLLGL
jgi:hypothetical protein